MSHTFSSACIPLQTPAPNLRCMYQLYSCRELYGYLFFCLKVSTIHIQVTGAEKSITIYYCNFNEKQENVFQLILNFQIKKYLLREADDNIAFLLNSYLIFLMPCLQYFAQFWTPQYQTDRNILKLVQQNVGKMTKGLEHLLHEEQLRELVLFSLKKRRSRGFLSQCA